VLIFARAGAEAGKIKRVLDDNLISWGFFTDHNQFEPHCNAHANNFVVVDPRSNKDGNILAVVDLDMAFSFSEFVNTIEPDPFFFTDAENLQLQTDRFKTNDRLQFDDWNNSEKYELEVSLAGLENMANFKYKAEETSSMEVLKLISTVLSDVCVLQYRRAYNKQESLVIDALYKERITFVAELVG
jgi:hypothetical protein